MFSFSPQAPWERQAECVTSRPEAQTAVRSCAAAGATTPCGSNVSPSASVSSSGAARWSAKIARKLWTFTPVSPISVLIGWT